MKPYKARAYRLTSYVALVLFLALLPGCGDYTGRYSDGTSNGKFINIDADSIHIGANVNGSFVSNYGKIASKTKSADGKTITLTGVVDYSGGSGTGFGVTVQPGQERHWTKPFTATINTEARTINFDGTLIVDSLDMRSWSVKLKKE